MTALKIASPQSAPEAVLRRVRNAYYFVLILETRNRYEGSEDFFLADSIFRFCRNHGRLDVTAGLKTRIGRRLAARQDVASRLFGYFDVTKNAIPMAWRR